MFILRDLFNPLQTAFSGTEKAQERALWFTYTLLAILTPITCARTSNLLRCLQSLFSLSISKRRFYTFMASPKLSKLASEISTPIIDFINFCTRLSATL